MDKNFDNDSLTVTLEHDKINSTILEQASDTAEKLTTLSCEISGITEYIHTMEGNVVVLGYTEEAQEVFNIYYDEQVDELYNLLNRQLKIIEPCI